MTSEDLQKIPNSCINRNTFTPVTLWSAIVKQSISVLESKDLSVNEKCPSEEDHENVMPKKMNDLTVMPMYL